MYKKYNWLIRLSFSLTALVLVLISCQGQKETAAVPASAVTGRWNHMVQGEDSIGLELSLAFFDDSSYYLTQNIPFEHSSGNFIIKRDTLVLFKEVPSSPNLSFTIELKKDTLFLYPLNENDRLKYRDFIGSWVFD